MRPVFIGDEATATGYRLAGMDVRTPPIDQARAVLGRVVEEEPPLVLITMEYADELPEHELVRILARVSPPVLPVADVAGRVPVIDLVAWIRRRIIA